jgi:hypothetical protein
MAEVVGINDLKEVLKAVNLLSIFIIKQVKNGIDMSDATALVAFLMASENQAVLKDAVAGIGSLPAEIKDLSLAEGLEVCTLLIASVPEYFAALKA